MYRSALRAFIAALQPHDFTDEQLHLAAAAWIDSIGNRSNASDLEGVAADQISQRDLFSSAQIEAAALDPDPAEDLTVATPEYFPGPK